MFCVVPVAKAHPRYRRRYRSRSSENGALLCRSRAAGSVKIFSNMTNLHDDGPSARAQIYVASITAVRCPAAAQKLHRAHKIRGNITVVVAGKPTNKAEGSVAEPVEPRTGTKGNADQQSTRRSQDRESVAQALERVRQAARRGKKEKFTSLLHHVDTAMLRTAFYAMKRDAAPGVDGMIWETYERDLDRRIEDLHARVKSGA